jgi:hypothetical protein
MSAAISGARTETGGTEASDIGTEDMKGITGSTRQP